MGGGSFEGILTGEVELAYANLIPRSHGFGITQSRRFSWPSRFL